MSRLDLAIQMHEPMVRFLRQDKEEQSSFPESVQALEHLIQRGP